MPFRSRPMFRYGSHSVINSSGTSTSKHDPNVLQKTTPVEEASTTTNRKSSTSVESKSDVRKSTTSLLHAAEIHQDDSGGGGGKERGRGRGGGVGAKATSTSSIDFISRPIHTQDQRARPLQLSNVMRRSAIVNVSRDAGGQAGERPSTMRVDSADHPLRASTAAISTDGTPYKKTVSYELDRSPTSTNATAANGGSSLEMSKGKKNWNNVKIAIKETKSDGVDGISAKKSSSISSKVPKASSSATSTTIDGQPSTSGGDEWKVKRGRLMAKIKSVSAFHCGVATIDKLGDKVLLHIFSYLSHKEILKCSRVCNKWRTLAYDSRLWQMVSLRPNYDGLQVTSIETLLAYIGARFGPSLRLMELQTDLITPPVMHELANKCPHLEYLTLDFSTAMQLHDFADMQVFPARLKSLTLCLSENIFLEGFMRKIYSFISSLEVLHLVGTYEKIEDEEEEVYETVNIHKLKTYTPNLRVVNLWGVAFVTDDHVESLSSNTAFLECICVNYCIKVTGSCLKLVVQRCKRLRTLLLEHCGLHSKHMMAVEWEKTNIQELNITATELTTEALISVLTRLPQLRCLSAGFLENFNDQVMEAWMQNGACSNLQSLDLNTCDSLSDSVLIDLINRCGDNLIGIGLGGHHKLLENFWVASIPKMPNMKILVMGIAEDCCSKVTAKIHIDQFIDCIAQNCPHLERLEIRWDQETLRFSDKSSKFVDILRVKCLKLRSLVLTDGQYFELVKSNFERADRMTVVRTTNNCRTSLVSQLSCYRQLLFN